MVTSRAPHLCHGWGFLLPSLRIFSVDSIVTLARGDTRPSAHQQPHPSLVDMRVRGQNTGAGTIVFYTAQKC
jgi:hypothetical protein